MPGALPEVRQRQAAWVRDEFLSNALERTVIELLETVAVDQVAQAPGGGGAVMVYMRVMPAAAATLRWLGDQGFFLVDTAVQLSMPRSDLAARAPAGYVVRRAAPKDEEAVTTLAACSFLLSRFHRDPYIARSQADRVKTQWVKNFFLGKRGTAMYVADRSGEIAGFLLLIDRPRAAPERPGRDLVLDLLAVGEAHRRRGLARALITAAQAAAPACDQLVVGTQLINTGALAAYARLGFRIVSAQHVWHYHREFV